LFSDVVVEAARRLIITAREGLDKMLPLLQLRYTADRGFVTAADMAEEQRKESDEEDRKGRAARSRLLLGAIAIDDT
jgi:hypothetical protein